MGIIDRLLGKRIQASVKKEIQASITPEGIKDPVLLESLLTGERINTSIPGTTNAFRTYESQVTETYKKYNGRSDFGVAQTRAVIDLRTAMIAGEGISISTRDPKLSTWVEKFLTENNLSKGPSLVKAVKGSEMCGQSLFKLIVDKKEPGNVKIKVLRAPYLPGRPFRVIPEMSDLFIKGFKDIEYRKESNGQIEEWCTIGKIDNIIYVRTGGDDWAYGNDWGGYGPTTKVGVVLTDIENYDRAIKDMRRNNHITARVTPVFETKDDNSAKSLKKMLEGLKWKIGKAFIGSAKFRYESPNSGAHENLKTELVATIKNISATTSVPVHWFAFVDLMSNRSTADSLYEMIKHGTTNERTEWETALYNLILKAQELYIDSGGDKLSKINTDFQVRLPLLDFSNFLEKVKALEIAYADEAISIDDYRNSIPGIDPLKTEKAIEKRQKDDIKNMKKQGDLLNKFQQTENKNPLGEEEKGDENG